jgi:UDP-N-acetylmuramate--alanine ligase
MAICRLYNRIWDRTKVSKSPWPIGGFSFREEVLTKIRRKGLKRIHLVGVSGIGMSAIAKILIEEGFHVTGSADKRNELVDSLEEMGLEFFLGHRPENVIGADLVVRTAAVKPDNPEIVKAGELGIETIKYAQMLGRIMEGKKGIAVAGTHGKTTTSALISLILINAGLDPTVVVGGEIVELGTNGRRGRGEFMVAEACEFDGSFLNLSPLIAVVTNVEADHLDWYPSLFAIKVAFREFMLKVPEKEGLIIACVDSPNLKEILPTVDRRKRTYGLSMDAEWTAERIRFDPDGVSFVVKHKGEEIGEFSVAAFGIHNVYNSLAAIATSWEVGIDMEVVRRTLSSYKGVKRRFELVGYCKGITIIDDYAHHPTEIKATIEAARKRFSRRIWCVFQPHLFSRTKYLLEEFSESFYGADKVVITEIYGAREEGGWDVNGEDLARSISAKGVDVVYIPRLEDVPEYLLDNCRPGDIVMTIGAGNVDVVARRLKELLDGR